MVTDLRLDENLDTFLDGANDLATISGIDQLEQSTALDVLNQAQQFSGGRLTGTNVGLLEERVRTSLESDPQIENVVNVSVAEYNTDTGAVQLDVVVTNNDNFTIELIL